MSFLSRFQPNRPLHETFTARSMNDLVDRINRAQPKFVGKGTRIMTTPGGTLVTLPRNSASPPKPAAWPWKVYNTSVGNTGQVQLNGGDGLVASLNSFVCDVNGSPNDTKSGSPPAYPQLPISGDGVVYGYAIPTTPGSPTLTSLDLFYGGTVPSVDTANPATYYPFLVATITDYATDGSGNVSFTVNNATNYGWTTLIYCGASGEIQIY